MNDDLQLRFPARGCFDIKVWQSLAFANHSSKLHVHYKDVQGSTSTSSNVSWLRRREDEVRDMGGSWLSVAITKVEARFEMDVFDRYTPLRQRYRCGTNRREIPYAEE